MNRKESTSGLLRCSFCGKSQNEVKKLIAGPGVYICDECIELCNEMNELRLPGLGWKLMQPARHADVIARLALVAHIHLTRGILADQHSREARANAFALREIGDLSRDLRLHRLRQLFAIQKHGSHNVSPWRAGSRQRPECWHLSGR